MPRFIVDTSPAAAAKVAAGIAERLQAEMKAAPVEPDITAIVEKLDREFGNTKWREPIDTGGDPATQQAAQKG